MAFGIGRMGWNLITYFGLNKSTFSSKEHKAFSGVSGCEGKEPEVTVPLASVVLLSPWWLCVLDRLGLRRGEEFQEAAYVHSVFLPPPRWGH